MEIGDVTVLDGTASIEDAIVLDVDTAIRAINAGEIEQLIATAIRALSLSGKTLVYVKQEAE